MPPSQDFRDHLRQLAIEPSIDWIDCQSRKDVMNFFPFDPIAGHGIDAGAARRNPTIVPVRFRDIIKPEHYNRVPLEVLPRPFPIRHGQRAAAPLRFFHDRLRAGSLRERMAQPEAALAVAIGDAAAREWAWKTLKPPSPARPDAADLGEMEPSARRRG